MSLGTVNLITYIAGFTVGAVLIAEGLLRVFGIDWSTRGRRPGKTVPARSSLLIGVGFSLMTAARIPAGHRLLWDLLMLLGTVLFVWGMVLFGRAMKDRETQ